MRIIPSVLLAGVGSLVFAGAVAAQSLPVHSMKVQLPDGTIEVIHYRGDVAPQIAFRSEAALPSAFWGFGPGSPFARMERISAAMDREAASMLRQAALLAAQPMPGPDRLLQIDARNLPPGAASYSFVATLSPGDMCTRSMEITRSGPGAKPHVVTHSFGNCSGNPNVAVPDTAPVAAPPAHRSDILPVKADGAKPFAGDVREASLQSGQSGD
ncbi:MAG TPA: hypothetical protein VMU87_04955 [Stellaceae bacterium]|nr:hypothetical protein [Stellaceae bacterium]